MNREPPAEIVAAANLVSTWFEKNSIHTWAIANCKNRWQRQAAPESARALLEVPQDWALLPKAKP